jgi:hypothetical protein
MDALNRLREAIEDTHDGTKPLNDESYRTMMNDLRDVFKVIPQHVEKPVEMETERTEPLFEVIRFDNSQGGMPRREVNRMAVFVADEAGENVWGMWATPVAYEFIQRLNANTLTKQHGLNMTDGNHEAMKIIVNKILLYSHKLKDAFMDKVSKTWVYRKFLIRRVTLAKTHLNHMLGSVAGCQKKNPKELLDRQHFPMLVCSAAGFNLNRADSVLTFKHTIENFRTAKLKENNVSNLHKLEIILKGVNTHYIFDAYTTKIKLGNSSTITDALYSMLMYIEWEKGIVHTKMVAHCVAEHDCSPPDIRVSGITAATKDKQRKYTDVGGNYTVTYTGKLNNG